MKEKYCPKCKDTREIKHFAINKSKKDGLSGICKDCKNEINKEYYSKNKEKLKQSIKENKDRIKELFSEYRKTQSCKKCGDNRWYVLDFHHIDPTQKEDEISVMVHNACSFESIKKEIDKCIPLCRNCHAELHFLNRENELI